MNDLDLLIVGAGQATGPLMEAAKAAGVRAAVAERAAVGGSCVNWGCTPTKAVLASTRLLGEMRRAAEFGISCGGATATLESVFASARKIVAHSTQSLSDELGDRLLCGHARLLGRDGDAWRVIVGEDEVRAKRVVLNLGSHSKIPPIECLKDPITGENWLHRTELPRRLALLGGGYISVEMAGFYRRMGSEVTVVESTDQILSHETPEVASAVQRCLESEGIRFVLGTKVEKIEGTRLVGTDVEADAIFVAVGREPNSHGMGLEEAGIERDDAGWITIDDRCRTSQEGVWAVGDVRGGAMFTPTSWDDGRCVASQLYGTGDRQTRATLIPYAVYTEPQLGRVGDMEGEILTFDMAKNGAAQAERAAVGQVWLAHQNGVVKGAAVLSAHGADVVQMITPFVAAGLTVGLLKDILTIHPTWSEGVQSAAL